MLAMDGMESWVLNASRDAIVQDLQPKYVLQYLVGRGVVTDDQRASILRALDEEDQASILLDVVGRGGRRAYDVFKKCLVMNDVYDWLAETIHANEQEHDRRTAGTLSLQCVLTRGGVPQMPVNYVERPAWENRVRETLSEAFKGDSFGWVVIHGMAGGGKTLLAASVVRQEGLLGTLYLHGIYWLKIGKGNEENLLSKMHSLCEKLDSSYRNSLPVDLDMATDRLRTILTRPEYASCLLVLDDVWNDFVVRLFDFGCRILVTTRDKSIADVASNKVFFVEMTEGFTLDESQRFFAGSLGMHMNELPLSSHEIWQQSKGCPLVAAIVSAEVKTHPKKISEAFDVCLKKLRDNTLVHLRRKSSYEYPCIYQALQMSVESLEDKKDHYYDLAIFPQNEYVSDHVLSVLWDVDTWDVEETMNTFINKSMAIKVPNGRHTNYYHVHDLCLQYMMSTVASSLPGRHERLINEYLKKCDGKFENLPSDGYILHYLGYHIDGAQMYDRFPEVFLNLKFVVLKLNSTGFTDVMGDYTTYKKYIGKTKEHSKRFADFEDFLRSSWSYRNDSVKRDIIQLALFQPPDSDVYIQAKQICSEKPDSNYFEWCNRKKLAGCSLSTQHHTHHVHYATFTLDGNHVISVGDDLLVRVWDSHSGKEILRMDKHCGSILCCAVAFDHASRTDVILTGSADNTAAIWNLSSNDYNFKSSKAVPVQYIFGCSLHFKKHNAKVMACSLTKCGGKAATMDENGVIKVWSTKTGVQFSSWEAHAKSFNICSCDFSPDGSHLVSAAGPFLVLWHVDKGLPEWEFEDRDRYFTCCRYTTDGNRVVAAVDCQLTVFSARDGARRYSLCEPTRTQILGCAVSSDGKLVAASTTNQSVIVWNLDDRKVVDIFHGRTGWVRSVSFCGNRNRKTDAQKRAERQTVYRLVSGHKCGIVMLWKTFGDCEVKETLLRELLSVQFDSNGEPMSAVVDVNNKIQVRHGDKQSVIAAENGSVISSLFIRCCAIANNCDRVLCGTTSGILKVFNVSSCTAGTLKHMLNCEVSCCAFSSNDDMIAAGYSNGAIYIFINNLEVNLSGHRSSITKIMFFTNEFKILSSSFDNTLRIWDAPGGRQLNCLGGHADSVLTFDVSSDGGLIVSASADKTMKLWNPVIGSKLASLEGHTDCVRSCRFVPTATAAFGLLASGDDLGMVAVWRYKHVTSDAEVTMAMATELLTKVVACSSPSWVYDLAFSSDGSQLVTATDTVQWWDTKDFLPGYADGDRSSCVVAATFRPQRSIPVQGSHVGRLVASPKFSSFVAVDDAGILYHFKKVNSTGKS